VVRKPETSLLSRKGNLMLTQMLPVRFWITLTVAALSLSPGALAADNQETQKAGRAVRLVWFPRFSPDGKRLITAHGSWDANEGGEVRVWEAETGKPIFVIPTERGVRTVAWAPNGKSFVSGDYGGSIFFYDAETGNQTDQIKLPGNVEVLQSSPDGKRLFAAAGDGSIRVWELPSKNQVYTWKQLHRGGIWGMALSPDGKMLATAGQDHFARLLDTENFKVLHEFEHPADVNGIVFSNDNKTVLTGCGDAAIRVFDVASSNEIRKLEGHTQGSVTGLDFSPDGKFLASGAMDRTVRIWDLVDFERPKLKSTVGGFNDFVFGVAISPNGKWLAAVGWDDQIKLLDLSTVEEKWSWRR
jgi:WD40 repeat protein